MALTFNNIDSASATRLLGSASGSSGRSGSSFASAITSQFVSRQASLVLNRATSRQRLFIFQQLERETVALDRGARELLGFNDERSPLNDREVLVGDSSVLTAKIDAFAPARSFDIQIDQLAAAQVVRSDSLVADDDHDLGNKDSEFRLTVGSEEYDFEVDVGDYDTNQEVLDAVAAEFNSAGESGVFAEVVSDESTGEIFLRLSAGNTGTDFEFTVSDEKRSLLEDLTLSTEQTADAEAGTGGILTSAQNARFSIDGGATQTSQRNVIDLFDGSVELTLTGTTDGEATSVTIQPDVSGIASALTDFVDAFNGALDFAINNPSEISSPLAVQLQGAISGAGSSLSQIGIRQSTSTNLLEIDQSELAASIADGRFARVSAAFLGPAGLATVSQRVSEQFRKQPASFLTHPKSVVDVQALNSIQRSESRGLLVDLIA